MRSASSLLVLLVVCQAAGCQAPDACEGQGGTCLSVLVQGSVAPIDAVRFDLSGSVQHSFTRMLPAGATALPVQEGVVLPAGVQGNILLDAVALLGGLTVGLGTVTVAVSSGGHASAEVNVNPVEGACRDGIKDHEETDVDCGGPQCPPCDMGRACAQASDCMGGNCAVGQCSAALLFAVGTFLSSVAIGDLNGDGKPDLAVANNRSNSIAVLINQSQ